MNEGIVTQVKEALAPVADKLQQGAEFMYGVYYKQTMIEGILMIVVPIVLIPVLCTAFWFWAKFAWKMEKKNKEKSYYYANGWMFGLVFSGAACLLLVGVGVGTMIEGAMKLANPHYYTIQRVVDSVKAKEVK